MTNILVAGRERDASREESRFPLVNRSFLKRKGMLRNRRFWNLSLAGLALYCRNKYVKALFGNQAATIRRFLAMSYGLTVRWTKTNKSPKNRIEICDFSPSFPGSRSVQAKETRPPFPSSMSQEARDAHHVSLRLRATSPRLLTLASRRYHP